MGNEIKLTGADSQEPKCINDRRMIYVPADITMKPKTCVD